MKGERQRNGLRLHSASVCDRGHHCGPPELVLVPLPASVGKFNCLSHPFFIFCCPGCEAEGGGEKSTHAGQKAEVNKAEHTWAAPEQTSPFKTSKRSAGKHDCHWCELSGTPMSEDLRKEGENESRKAEDEIGGCVRFSKRGLVL